MPSVYLYVCHEYVCSTETSNPTYFFHCLNERVKRLLVVITVINDFFFCLSTNEKYPDLIRLSQRCWM